MLIYKILNREQWRALEELGETEGAPIDRADGFIHFSTGAQVAETARKHFAGVEGLWLVAVELARLEPAVRWEPSRGGDLFPHLYGTLRRDLIAWAKPLPVAEDGTHAFPDGVVE